MTMVRAQRKRVKKPTNTTRGIPCRDSGEQSSQEDKKLNIRWKSADKSVTGKFIKRQSVHNLKKAVVLLEDIAVNSSLVSKRNVLGDKTNYSPMSPINQKQNRSTDEKSHQKMSCNLPGEISEGRSPYKLSDSRNILCAKKSPLEVISSEGNLQNQPKSSQFSEKCIYTKVQRETLRNKMMPLEEKLAQYEFEVDENECVVKKKKKKNVKHRKKVKSKEVYCPPSKVFQKIFQAGVEEAEEKIKAKPKNVGNVVQPKFDFSSEDNCTEQTIGCEVQDNSLSPLVPPSNRKSLRSFSENLCSDGRPDSRIEKRNIESGKVNTVAKNTIHNTSLCGKSLRNLDHDVSVVTGTPKVMPTANTIHNTSLCGKSLRNLDHDVSVVTGTPKVMRTANTIHNTSLCGKSLRNLDHDVSVVTGTPKVMPTANTIHNTSLCGKSLHNLDHDVSVVTGTPKVMPTANTIHNTSLCGKSLHKLDQDVSVVTCTPKVMHTAKNRCNNKSDLFKYPNQQLASSFGNTVSSSVQNNDKDARFSLSEVTSTSTPVFQSTPLNRNCQAAMNVSLSANECSVNHSVNWIKRVSVVPRESGGVNNSCENVLAENWSVDNCFGFDDVGEEPVELPPLTDLSLKQRLRNNSPVNKTNSSSKKRKWCRRKGKENESSPLVKRRPGLTALVSPKTSFKLDITDKNSSSVMNKSNASINTSTQECSERDLETSVADNPSSPVAAGLSPFSKPLKQTKLDFLAVESNTSTCETPKKDDEESPLLFKELDDKTPIHFKQPARRSYVRSVRKKLRPVGFEWIEIDSESEEEGERSHHPAAIKRKRTKLNKHEEKEANKWMKDFNRQCEEIEGFELCVEK